MEELIQNLKKQIIEHLYLEGVEPADIEIEEPLFNEGLGLDSIDALELMVLLDKNYGITIKTAEDGKEIFYSVKTLAEYIQKNK